MKKIISILLCLALIAGLTLSVSAVTVDTAATGTDQVGFYVYLTGEDAEYTFGMEYDEGDIPARPADPGREGMTFIDWYSDRGYHHRFDFSEPLYEDTEIFGRFAPTEDVIGINVFDSPSADEPLYGYLLVKGDYAEYPDDPEYAEDEWFMGWYTDRALTQEFDFSQPVYDNTYLFPRIVKEENLCWAALYLSADATEPVSYIAIEKGDLCPVPAEPGKEGMAFAGWYTDRALTKPMDFSKPCTKDFDLFAKWEAVCSHPHLLDHFVQGYPATETTDGRQDYLKCPSCGKIFYGFPVAMIEAESMDDLIIDATGPMKLGDADGNGDVESVDVTVIQRKNATMKIGSFCRRAADVDADGDVSVVDATFIQRHLSYMNTRYLIGAVMIPRV